jgi:methionine sulfoxide reductase heme-binding subunit
MAARMITAMSSSLALWYSTRGTGLVALLLLTASVALGIAEAMRWASPRFPRFVIAALHKNISLLVVAFVAIHIVSAIADNYAPIGWIDVIVPFHSPYRPLWLGAGTVAFDLLAALTVTSLLRQRIGYRAWRLIHWTSYACWPITLLHGLGTGTDTRLRWSLLLSVACLAVVTLALCWRLIATRTVRVAVRVWAAAASSVLVALILAWTFTGPTRPGWARRAGTPARLLTGDTTRSIGTPTLLAPFDARLTGTSRTTPTAGKPVDVTINVTASLSGGASGTMHLALEGPPLAGGGIQLARGTATLGTVARPDLYQGPVVALNGSAIRAQVRDATGRRFAITISVSINRRTGSVTGTVSARRSSN